MCFPPRDACIFPGCVRLTLPGARHDLDLPLCRCSWAAGSVLAHAGSERSSHSARTLRKKYGTKTSMDAMKRKKCWTKRKKCWIKWKCWTKMMSYQIKVTRYCINYHKINRYLASYKVQFPFSLCPPPIQVPFLSSQGPSSLWLACWKPKVLYFQLEGEITVCIYNSYSVAFTICVL